MSPFPLGPSQMLHSNPFFTSPVHRVGLARQRFFDEGVRPTGLVSEPVIQSWTRCLQRHCQPSEPIAFEPVGRSRIASTLARNRVLLGAALPDIGQLEATLAGTACKAILTDASGVVVHSTHTERSEGELMWLAHRVGVDLAEECVGTTAPGVVAKTGQACVVHGAEHYFDQTWVMYCAAAPIRDARGELVAVLDLSCEAQPFRFDAASVVRLYATAIENRLFTAQARRHVLVRFQATPSLLHTPLEGLAAIDGCGRLDWINAAGASLLTAPREDWRGAAAEEALGMGMAELLALARAGRPMVRLMPNGLTLYLEAQAADERDRPLPELPPPATPAGSATPSPAAFVPPTLEVDAGGDHSLQEAKGQLIDRTLAACGGNVSRAARDLGVSRGLIYRRLRQRPPARNAAESGRAG